MNWCMGESHYCVSKHPLKGWHKFQMGTQFIIWMKPVGVSLWKAQLGLHFSRAELVTFLPNSRKRSKPFIFMACNVVFYYFFSMICNTTRVVARRDHDIQKQMKLKLFWIGHICISSLSSIFPLWLSVQQLAVCVNPEKPCRARGNPGGS